MEFMDLAKARFSLRSYSDRDVEPEKLTKILEAGRIPLPLKIINHSAFLCFRVIVSLKQLRPVAAPLVLQWYW